MSITSLLNFFFYEMHSSIHSKPRMRRIINSLFILPFTPSTIIDYGCGYGELIKYIETTSFSYNGFDNDYSSVNIARLRLKNRVNSRVELVNDVSDVSFCSNVKDSVLIFNGVSHHLEEECFNSVIQTTNCSAIIILDHDGSKEKLSKIQNIFQILDKGKYIRPKNYFDNISNYKCISSEIFYIPSLLAPFWRYFMNVYVKIDS
ncbi:MAG TPA: methyltransferase domain-containing protein [Oligoflexia bacterium]|nr:methyltransferase domain-containing protein [Oligoflexia bacterium]HMP47621.1 methyltransferase domain-containing protein [Oligoflexia bacterium]